MKKIKYYLDTTIFNFVFEKEDLEKKKLTEKLFKDLPSIAEGIYISDEVVREISRAPESKRLQLEYLLKKTAPFLLRINSEIEKLANSYIKEGIIPEKYRGDALHIAAAVVNGIEVIISWNFEHIVKLKTRVMVNGLNKLLGYSGIEICSPEEVTEI
ncbi:MAG: PIN domain-containing protein [Candidatus Ratteibacteria bacterium]|nr:PIN domain-containing protein [Candidatus Ratteibacteria bacterium]